VRLALVAGADTMRHIGQVVQHLTVGLVDAPVHVTVVAPASVDLSNLPSPPVGVLTYDLDWFGKPTRRTVEAIGSQLAGRNIELLHALDGTAHSLTRKLSEVGDWPYLVSVLGLGQSSRLTPLGAHCKAVLAASMSIRAKLLSRHVAPPEQIIILRPGIHRVRQANCFARPGRRPAIIAGGELNVYEPFSTAIKAFADLVQSHYDCVLFIFGNGKAEHRLRVQAQRLGLMGIITFVDRMPQHQLADVFKAADVLVYPHSNGMLEMDVLQAMAAGIPVLVGGACVGDFVMDAETAISYSAASQADLTAKLKMLLDEPNNGIAMAESALAYLGEHHSPAQMVADLAALYREHIVRLQTVKVS